MTVASQGPLTTEPQGRDASKSPYSHSGSLACESNIGRDLHCPVIMPSPSSKFCECRLGTVLNGILKVVIDLLVLGSLGADEVQRTAEKHRNRI